MSENVELVVQGMFGVVVVVTDAVDLAVVVTVVVSKSSQHSKNFRQNMPNT